MDEQQKLQAEEMRTTLLRQLDNGEADMQQLSVREDEIEALRKQNISDVANTRMVVVIVMALVFPGTLLSIFGGIVLSMIITSAFGIPENSPQEEQVQMICVVGGIVLLLVIAVGICIWYAIENRKQRRKRCEQMDALEQECSVLRCADSLLFLPVEYRTKDVWSRLRKAAESNCETMQSVLERYQKKMQAEAFLSKAGSIAGDVTAFALEILSDIV